MKIKELITEEELKEIWEKEDQCSLCEVHERANESIQAGHECPHCGAVHTYEEFVFDEREWAVVGEHNGVNLEESIFKREIITCKKCDGHFVLTPEKVIYNGNHDIYYSGGKFYLNDEDSDRILADAEKRIRADLDQFVRRFNEGDKLEVQYPAMWMRASLEHAIAEYLFVRGFKK